MIRQTRVEEVNDLFERALPVIHSTLEGFYRLNQREARDAEHDLFVWFHRFARRIGNVQIPVRSMKLSLLLAACQYGRSLQLWKQEGAGRDESLARALEREPRDLASELVTRLDRES